MDPSSVSQPQPRRTKVLVASAVIFVAILGLLLWAMTRPGSTSFYMTTSELAAAGPTNAARDYRVNGYLVPDSVTKDGFTTTFDITDGTTTVTVTTDSPLPDAFYSKEKVDIVAQGDFDGAVFTASDVFAKCPSKFKAQA